MIQFLGSNRAANESLKESARKAYASLLSRQDLGFIKSLERKSLFEDSSSRAEYIKKHYTATAFVGIGGSSLGARAIKQLFAKKKSHKLIFFENVDPMTFESQMADIEDLLKVHWVIISKSGGTMETLALADLILKRLPEFKPEQFTVISELKSNPLTDWANAQQVKILELPQDVGGRFSVLTPVGLLPAALLDIDLEEIKDGIRQAFKQEGLIVELTAQTLASFERGEWITAFWFYADALRSFGAWIQQLWAESLAKTKTRTAGRSAPRVSTPMPCIGAVDQHSILQQVAEGARDKFVWFFRVKSLENSGDQFNNSHLGHKLPFGGWTLGQLLGVEASATYEALDQMKISCLKLSLDDLSSKTVAEAFMLFELVVGSLGEVLDINAYDQPGVELGKKLANEILINKVVRDV